MSQLSLPTQGKTLLVVDIDHTLMESEKYEGSEPWFQNLLRTNVGKSTETVIDLYCSVQNQLKMRPVEAELPSIWEQWHAHPDISILGLTSRSYCLAEITHQQLGHAGLPFNSPLVEVEVFEGVGYGGVLFGSGANKGELLDNFLEQHPHYQKNHIIFIDDSYHHVEHVGEILEKKGRYFSLYHYPTSRDRYEQQRHVPALLDNPQEETCDKITPRSNNQF